MSVMKAWRMTAAVAAVAGVIITTSIGGAEAKEIYSDETVGISTTFDMYAQTLVGGDSVATPADAADVQDKDTDKAEAAGSATEKKDTVRYPEFAGKCLVVTDDYVNIRAEGSTEAEIVGLLANNGLADVVQKGDGWTKIKSGDCEGYICNDYLKFGDEAGEYAEKNCTRMATVSTDILNVRAKADESADCLAQVGQGQSFEIVSESDDWIKIVVDADVTGYVSARYVETGYGFATAKSMDQIEQELLEQKRLEEEKAEAEKAAAETAAAAESEESDSEEEAGDSSYSSSDSSSDSTSDSSDSTGYSAASSGQSGVDLANFAMQFVGNPYVYGGSSLTNGADCSGFVMAVYAEYGYSLPHSAGMQSTYGTRVDISDIEPGDILFYGDGSIEHCGIYAGGGIVVHASTEETGIKTSPYNYRTPMCAVRILGQ